MPFQTLTNASANRSLTAAALPSILTINGGSSSIRFAVYEAGETSRRRLAGKIDSIGLSGTNLVVDDLDGKTPSLRRLSAADHSTAREFLLDGLEAQPFFASVKAAGHRSVHGRKHSAPEQFTPKLIARSRCRALGLGLASQMEFRRSEERLFWTE